MGSDRKQRAPVQPAPLRLLVRLFFAVTAMTLSSRCTMIRLRHEHKSSLQSDNLDFFHDDTANSLFVYHRYNAERTDHIVVVLNWSAHALNSYQVKNVPVAGEWREWSTSNVVTVTAEQVLTVDLDGQQGKIFILSKQQSRKRRRSDE